MPTLPALNFSFYARVFFCALALSPLAVFFPLRAQVVQASSHSGGAAGSGGALAAAPTAPLPDEETSFGRGLRGAADLVDIFGPAAGYQSGPKEPEVVIGTIIQGLFVVIGVIFGLLIIYGGFLWMTARGNEDYIKKAKGILEAAIIGFVLVAGAYAISSYIIDKVIAAAFRP